jgi:hypothetical protein
MKIYYFSVLGASVGATTPRRTALRRLVAPLSLLTVAVFGLAPFPAQASWPIGDNQSVLTSVATATGGGFWVQLDSTSADNSPSGTLSEDGAPVFESIPDRGTIAAIPGRYGYWVVSNLGKITARGDAPQLCNGQLSTCSGFPARPSPSQYIVAAAASLTGRGLWAVGRDGKVWTAGDARPFGDVQKETRVKDNPLGKPLVPTGIAAINTGRGYYIVMSDGGVFSFGDAKFYGSTGGVRPGGHNITGIALCSWDYWNTVGYWLVLDDGSILAFGQAPWWGDPDGNGRKITGIVSFPVPAPGQLEARTQGYAAVSDDGELHVVRGTSWSRDDAQ